MLFSTACHTTKQLDQSAQDRIRYELAELDRFGSVYLINSENEVVKYDAEDQLFGYYSNNTLGDIGYLDVTNPLKLLLYYPAYYTAVFLDRQLRETRQVNFLDLQLGEVRAVATATNGSLWIFDYNQQKLRNIDQSGQVLLESNELRLTLGKTIDVRKIKQWGETVYVHTQSGELLLFDLFGYYQLSLREGVVRDFQAMGDGILIKYDDRSVIAGTDLLSHREIDLPLPENAKILRSAEHQVLVSASGYERQVVQR